VSQLLLFPDPRPLVERFGADFFKTAPQSAGVYFMRDATDAVLYVGKAKNLRKRLCSYRVANPDRLRKRQLRLLHSVRQIDWELCADERAALARESELLLSLRPRFNRAGAWPSPRRFVTWKTSEKGLVFALSHEVLPGWHFYGPLGRVAVPLRASMARLAWCAIHQQDYSLMPQGWWELFQERKVIIIKNHTVEDINEKTALELAAACAGDICRFANWVHQRTAALEHPFTIAFRELDLQQLNLLEKDPSEIKSS
jgi:hypothetical protein